MVNVHYEQVTKRYGNTLAVSPTDLILEDGSLTVLVGPSGCGKTTTLRMLAGLETVSSGRILIGDKDVTKLDPAKRNIAMVFQNYALYAHLSVDDNIMFPLRAHKVPRSEAAVRASEVEAILGLEKMATRRTSEMSGGQQQRVAIARALVRKPDVFLFDEPLSNLDAQLRVSMRSEIHRIQRQIGTTTLYVTHDQEEAMTLADKLVVMKNGKISQIGKPQDLYEKPANRFTASFVGNPQMNIVEGFVDNGVFGQQKQINPFAIPVETKRTGAVFLGFRPEDVLLQAMSKQENTTSPADAYSVPLKLSLTESLGPRAIFMLETASGNFLFRAVVPIEEASQYHIGDWIRLAIKPGKAHYFDVSTQSRLEW